MYDVTIKSSFTKGVPRMHQFIKNCASDNASIILVSNKTEEDRSSLEREGKIVPNSSALATSRRLQKLA